MDAAAARRQSQTVGAEAGRVLVSHPADKLASPQRQLLEGTHSFVAPISGARREDRIAFLVGTRPEAIKLAPVIHAARRQGLQVIVISSGQQHELARGALESFQIQPDVELPPLPSNSLARRHAELVRRLDRVLRRLDPKAVVVLGDTATALAGALVGFQRGVVVFHVEAGLRSGHAKEPFPEEIYRQAISRFANYHFATTDLARRNLLLEGVPPDRVFLTGSPVVDAVHWVRAHGGRVFLPEPLEALRRAGYQLIAVTAHRRENRGPRFRHLAAALEDCLSRATHVAVVLVGHPNGWASTSFRRLASHPRVLWVEPLGYRTFLSLIETASALVTDSGGLQEEACCLGKPALVVRKVTERPEAIEAGWCRLVDPDRPAALKAALERLLHHPWVGRAATKNPFGDGHASARIAAYLNHLLKGHAPEPLQGFSWQPAAAEASQSPKTLEPLP
jgi:UDP-N-acetylglucosamine 2-epimerase (non-hydrolysing)